MQSLPLFKVARGAALTARTAPRVNKGYVTMVSARWRQLNCGRDDELLAQVAAARNKGANGAAAVVFRREPGRRGARRRCYYLRWRHWIVGCEFRVSRSRPQHCKNARRMAPSRALTRINEGLLQGAALLSGAPPKLQRCRL